MRIAYVTTGDVGGGHVSRGLAIARGLAREGAKVDYRIFARPMPFPAIAGDPRFTFVEVDPAELRDPARAPESALARALRAFAPELVLVDLFWASLRHILPLPGAEAWLLLRCHPAGWIHNPFQKLFDATQYRRLIGIEPIARTTDRIEPVVVANPDELLPPAALKERLGIDPARRLHLVVQTGAQGEIDELLARGRAQAAEGDAVVPFSLWRDDALFPVAPWLAGADRIVAGGGYNLFWETQWLGLAGRAEIVPFQRTIDDQARRVRQCAGYAMRANGADQLARQIAGR